MSTAILLQVNMEMKNKRRKTGYANSSSPENKAEIEVLLDLLHSRFDGMSKFTVHDMTGIDRHENYISSKPKHIYLPTLPFLGKALIRSWVSRGMVETFQVVILGFQIVRHINVFFSNMIAAYYINMNNSKLSIL